MSWITIDGVPQQCTAADLGRWDEVAAKEGKSREEVAKAELHKPESHSRKRREKDGE